MLRNIAILAIELMLAFTAVASSQTGGDDHRCLDFDYGQDVGSDTWVQSIVVTAPELRSRIRGDTWVEFQAPGMKMAKVMCWRQPTREYPTPWGHDEKVAEMDLGSAGAGRFVFAADQFPHGPANLRIYAHNGDHQRDLFELQLRKGEDRLLSSPPQEEVVPRLEQNHHDQTRCIAVHCSYRAGLPTAWGREGKFPISARC